jgi:methylmalonyl-CoA mutase cobalamin-binding subunit
MSVPVVAGGIDEPEEIHRMLEAGVFEHFGPGSPLEDVVAGFQRAMRIELAASSPYIESAEDAAD